MFKILQVTFNSVFLYYEHTQLFEEDAADIIRP